MKLKTMIERYYNNDRKLCAECAGVSVQHLNNWVSQGFHALRLENGGFVLVTTKTKVFSNP